jgi:hypothetical protein
MDKRHILYGLAAAGVAALAVYTARQYYFTSNKDEDEEMEHVLVSNVSTESSEQFQAVDGMAPSNIQEVFIDQVAPVEAASVQMAPVEHATEERASEIPPVEEEEEEMSNEAPRAEAPSEDVPILKPLEFTAFMSPNVAPSSWKSPPGTSLLSPNFLSPFDKSFVTANSSTPRDSEGMQTAPVVVMTALAENAFPSMPASYEACTILPPQSPVCEIQNPVPPRRRRSSISLGIGPSVHRANSKGNMVAEVEVAPEVAAIESLSVSPVVEPAPEMEVVEVETSTPEPCVEDAVPESVPAVIVESEPIEETLPALIEAVTEETEVVEDVPVPVSSELEASAIVIEEEDFIPQTEEPMHVEEDFIAPTEEPVRVQLEEPANEVPQESVTELISMIQEQIKRIEQEPVTQLPLSPNPVPIRSLLVSQQASEEVSAPVVDSIAEVDDDTVPSIAINNNNRKKPTNAKKRKGRSRK